MPMPKAIVSKREEDDLPTEGFGEVSSFGNVPHQSPLDITNGSSCCTTTNQLKPAVKQPSKKKKESVKWSSDVLRKTGVSADASFRKQHILNDPEAARKGQGRRTANRSPSPSTSLTLLELEHDVKKQEASIRRACELELKLLNQCTRVREKRSRMVQRLRKLKRSMQKLAHVDKWTIAQFSFPPEYEVTPKARPIMIDMTQSDASNSEDLYEERQS